MKTYLTILFLLIYCYSSNAQCTLKDTFPVLDSLMVYRDVSVKNGTINPNHLVIIDGITIKTEEQLDVCLKNINANHDTVFGSVGFEKVRGFLNGKKARNGLILVTLDRRAHKQFSKNHKQFRKRTAADTP